MKERINKILNIIVFPLGIIAFIFFTMQEDKTFINYFFMIVAIPGWLYSMKYWISNFPIEISIKFKTKK